MISRWQIRDVLVDVIRERDAPIDTVVVDEQARRVMELINKALENGHEIQPPVQ